MQIINMRFAQGNYTPLFGIAEFLTIIGIFFAAYQLKTPKWELRIRYENDFLKWMRGWFIYAGALSLFGFLSGIFEYQSKYYEIGSLFILLYIGYRFWKRITTPITEIENTESFKRLVMDFLGQGGEQIAAIGSEVEYFFENLVNKIEEGDKEAYQILILCMDSRLCKNLICNQYNTIQKIISVYKNKIYLGNIHKVFLSSIIHTSLADNESIIARALIERKNTILLDQIFEKFSFISTYELYKETFGGINNSKNDRDLTPIYFNNYLRFFERILESFFDKNQIKGNMEYHQVFYGSLKRFSGEVGDDGLLRNNYKNEDIIRIIPLMYTKIQDIKDIKIQKLFTKNYSNTFNTPPFTFIDSVAHGIFDLLKSIAYIPENKDNTQRIGILCRMLYPSHYHSEIVLRIQERIKEYIQGHIKSSDINGYYPHMTRIFFHIFADKIFQEVDNEKEFYIEILKEIKKGLFLLAEGKYFEIDAFADKDTEIQGMHKEKIIKIVEDMLGPNMLFNPTDKTLIYYNRFSKKTLNLEKLEDNSIVIS